MLKNILETDRVKSPVIKLQSCEKKSRKCSKTKVLGQKQNRAFFMDHPVYLYVIFKTKPAVFIQLIKKIIKKTLDRLQSYCRNHEFSINDMIYRVVQKKRPILFLT